jgi:putative FmdB family regulatory protein
MPTYSYRCKSCGHEFEELQSISDPRLVRCPKCHKDTLVRDIGGGSGPVFKGSGFYGTDYKKKPSGESSETKPAKKESKEKPKTETKSTDPPPPKKSSGDSKESS